MKTSSWLLAAAVAALVALARGGSYDYCDALRKSLLFYQAQRSGRLSGMAPELWWRGDSAVNDRGQYGEDLEGGYYDAGDHVKFGFPMAFSMTMLSWGVVSNRAGYEKCGQLQAARDAILWGVKWLRKAHVLPDRLYGQVGLGQRDHDYWGRAECMAMERPAFYIDPGRPGSDLAAEAAAAFASASMVFRGSDDGLAGDLLARARQLFSLANDHRGKYSDSIPDANNFYRSWDYADELVWGAAWLAYATGEQGYVDAARRLYAEGGLQNRDSSLGWDSKVSGADLLLARLTNDHTHADRLGGYCDWLVNSAPRTPRRLVFLGEWGSLRNTANAVFVCLEAAKLGLKPDVYNGFAKEQIDYMLGDGGRSYVVGFGKNYPLRAHHRGSSCPADSCEHNSCGWNVFNSPEPNHNLLIGALVGGPDQNDWYEDKRDDAVKNEVALDYNAAYQGDVAALAALF